MGSFVPPSLLVVILIIVATGTTLALLGVAPLDTAGPEQKLSLGYQEQLSFELYKDLKS